VSRRERLEAERFFAELMGAAIPPGRRALIEEELGVEQFAEDAPWSPVRLTGMPGQMWSLTSSGGNSAAVYVPDAVKWESPLCLLIWIHGLLRVCGDSDTAPGATIAQSPCMPVARLVAASGRPVVLAVPAMNWVGKGGSSTPMETPDAFDRLVEDVRAGLEAHVAARPVRLRATFLAGHSRAYEVLHGLAAKPTVSAGATGGVAKLREVWSIDTTYGYTKAPSCDAWLAWARSRGDVTFKVFYLKNTGTATVGACLLDVQNGRRTPTNLAVRELTGGDSSPPCGDPHCDLIRRLWPDLLRDMRL